MSTLYEECIGKLSSSDQQQLVDNNPFDNFVVQNTVIKNANLVIIMVKMIIIVLVINLN